MIRIVNQVLNLENHRFFLEDEMLVGYFKQVVEAIEVIIQIWINQIRQIILFPVIYVAVGTVQQVSD